MALNRRPVVLIVEDEVDLHEHFELCLSEDADCLFATTLPEMRERVGSADLIVLDHTIPGCKFEDLLLETQGKPLVVVTGHLDTYYCDQLPKPFLRSDLLEAVRPMILQWRNRGSAFGTGDLPEGLKMEAVVRCKGHPELGTGCIVGVLGPEDAPKFFDVEFTGGQVQAIVKCAASCLEVADNDD